MPVGALEKLIQRPLMMEDLQKTIDDTGKAKKLPQKKIISRHNNYS